MKQEIDIVLLWVDGADKEWLAEKNEYLSKISSRSEVDASAARYRDWCNLRYLFRGIETYMPWIRRVHFVTNGQRPEWLNLSNPKLNWVKHSDFIPEEYLPTFSSHPIELNIHRIKGLSEKFIYFNDDTFATAPMQPSDFFYRGLPCEQSTFFRITSSDYEEVYWSVLLNNIGVINRNFPKGEILRKRWRKLYSLRNGILDTALSLTYLPTNHLPGFMNFHVPRAFLKATFGEVWQKEPIIMDSVSKNRFRDIRDVNQYLVSWWQLCSGRYYPKNVRRRSRNFSNPLDQLTELKVAIERKKYDFICISDLDYEDEDFLYLKGEVNASFEEALPSKSGFEI